MATALLSRLSVLLITFFVISPAKAQWDSSAFSTKMGYCEYFVLSEGLAPCQSLKSQVVLNNGQNSVASQALTTGRGATQLNATQHSWWEVLKNWSGVLALVISIATASLTHFHYSRSRTRSVTDDFWIRQVVYPEVLKPAFEFIQWCSDNLPPPTTPQSNDFSHLRREFYSKRGTLIERMNFLSALERTNVKSFPYRLIYFFFQSKNAKDQPPRVSDTTERQFRSSIEDIEDSLMSYLAALFDGTGSNDQFDEVRNTINTQRSVLVSSVFKWQNSV